MKSKKKNDLLRILILSLIVLSWTGCHKDPKSKDPHVSNVDVTLTATSANFSWLVEFSGQFQTGVELSEHEDMTDLRRVEGIKQEDFFVATIENLSAAKKYYYRIVTWNKFNSFEEEVNDFTTLSKTYTVSVSCNPEEGGKVTGGGTFTEGETCKITATANLNYNFVNWTENGNQINTEPECTFIVTSNRTLMANFSSKEYRITATANPEVGGMVSGSGGYNSGDECTLTAIPKEGYDFVNWTKEGTEVSANSSYTFTVTESAVYVANFQIKHFAITATADPENGGIVTGAGIYEIGQTCTVKATESNGYHFVNWTENHGQVSSNREYSFVVTCDRDLLANFTTEDYIISVEIEPENGGMVTGAGGYNYGNECTLTATAYEGYVFENWTENGDEVSTNDSYAFIVQRNRSLVANFEITIPTGAINGLFTINENGDQVFFSQGNLQYQATTNTWRFAENQWDYVGTQTPDDQGYVGGTINGSDNADISSNYNGWIDLFGWGTSNFNHGAICYQPWSCSTSKTDYLAYGNEEYKLYDQSGQADWGYNVISNGGNQENQWRTLTSSEWAFIINNRATNSGALCAPAFVNSVSGLILLPDSWDNQLYNLNNINHTSSWSQNQNEISASDWLDIFQPNGAVFLPDAGYRLSTHVNSSGNSGWYWSSSTYEFYYYSDVFIGWYVSGFRFSGAHYPDASKGLPPADPRSHGYSVRLVQMHR